MASRRSPALPRVPCSVEATASCQVSMSNELRGVFLTSEFTEYADVTESLLKSGSPFSLAKALNDPLSRPYIKTLTVSIHDLRRTLL